MPNLGEPKRRPFLVIRCNQKHVICLPFTSLRKYDSIYHACRDHEREPNTYYPVSPNQNDGIYIPITVPEYCKGYIDLLCPMTLGMNTIDWGCKMGRISDEDLTRVTEAHKRLVWDMSEGRNSSGMALRSAPVLAGHTLEGGNHRPHTVPGIPRRNCEPKTSEKSQLGQPSSSRQQIAPLKNTSSEIRPPVHSTKGPKRNRGSGCRPSKYRTPNTPYDRDDRGRRGHSHAGDRIPWSSRNGCSSQDKDGRQMRDRQASTENSSSSTRRMSHNPGDPGRGI
ncbi:unnamed protein product [Tuber melanosporum]|uniref:(Perigord truffle) hypothetical protein n=1 Tax=Tuber melanosporum (strain Mel28) TaxID=656061 RepID=D5GNW7_TUBMM|nr:uncharacterized protein GSTUM_00011550001 [Tuber melanosporum]CAZ86210.1 unnamed protein product [Tuber melanosporum]